MPLPHDDLKTMAHSFTGCTDEGMENRGYCTRCSLLAFEERDKFKAALEHVIECADYEAHGIASEALGVPNPDETILGLD